MICTCACYAQKGAPQFYIISDRQFVDQKKYDLDIFFWIFLNGKTTNGNNAILKSKRVKTSNTDNILYKLAYK